MDTYDVIIVGTGAGGGTLARHLARARTLETNAARTAVTAVVVERDGATERYTADIVVVACGAATTAALLLSSANDTYPNGLANGSDQVGRNYMFHVSQAVPGALARGESDRLPEDPRPQRLLPRQRRARLPAREHPAVGKSQEPMFRGEKPLETRLAPRWSLDRIARHAIDFWLSTEDLPLPGNRVTVDREGRLTLAYTPSNEVPKQKLYVKLRSILGKLRMEPDHLFGRFAYMKNDIPEAGCAPRRARAASAPIRPPRC